jgi:sodium pump decarboxylase gamma subunit
LGEIFRIALIDTALGMGTVFLILIFISVCIWVMGLLCAEKKPAEVPSAAAAVADEDGLSPEMVAVITAAVHQYIADENGGIDIDDYIVRNVRRATWRHTS